MSANRRTHNPLAAIEARQRQEDVVRDYARVTAENSRQKIIADWEIKTGKTVSSKELFRHMDVIQARHDDILVARRQRLADLLLREKEEHEGMLANLNETDEQRRERLTQQARELRLQRETLRKEEASRKLDQLFRESNDVLRQADSRVKAVQVADERQEQLQEIARRKEEERRIEQFYVEQKNEMERQQRERAQRDEEAIHNRTVRTAQDLKVQCEANRQRSAEEKRRQKAEDDEFFRLLREEQQRNAASDLAKRKHREALSNEIKLRNEELRQIKQDEYERLRQEDKDALDELLKGIAEDERREAEHRKRQREAAIEHMKLVEAQMNAQAANESALDKLWQEENDKEWDKREKKWLGEQQMREKLLMNVVQTRKSQIAEIREKEQLQAEAKRRDHQQLIETVTSGADSDVKAATARRASARNNQSFLATQMSARAETTLRERDSKMNDATGAQAAEIAYQQKLAAELKRLEDAKPDRFKHIPVQPKRNNIW